MTRREERWSEPRDVPSERYTIGPRSRYIRHVHAYDTDRFVEVPTTMLHRWGDELVLMRNATAAGKAPDPERLKKLILEIRSLAWPEPRWSDDDQA